MTIAQDPQVQNHLADTLFRRIERAHRFERLFFIFIKRSIHLDLIRLNEKFRVYIVLPLLPGFDNVNAVQAVLYFIMRSITKGDSSLFNRLERAGKFT